MNIRYTVFAAALSSAAVVAVPASAQVSGIATADAAVAVGVMAALG